jgi:ssDNA-binding Zn-finger/Zn-ribbon topoisomerase 1
MITKKLWVGDKCPKCGEELECWDRKGEDILACPNDDCGFIYDDSAEKDFKAEMYHAMIEEKALDAVMRETKKAKNPLGLEPI